MCFDCQVILPVCRWVYTHYVLAHVRSYQNFKWGTFVPIKKFICYILKYHNKLLYLKSVLQIIPKYLQSCMVKEKGLLNFDQKKSYFEVK